VSLQRQKKDELSFKFLCDPLIQKKLITYFFDHFLRSRKNLDPKEVMSCRDVEVLETIRRDDLAYLLTIRHEKPLEYLIPDDVPAMLQRRPSPMMIAAFFGSQKCFNFFLGRARRDYLDQVHFALIMWL
jgi:hypothetical protein